MLENPEMFSLPTLMFVISSVLLVLAIWTLLLARKNRSSQSRQLENLRQDFRALTSAARTVGQRVLEIERRQRNLAERQDQLDLYESANQPYEQAIRLTQRGANPQELVEVCGLSQGEAELVNLLHRLDKAS